MKNFKNGLHVLLMLSILFSTLYVGNIIMQKQTENTDVDFLCACIVYDWSLVYKILILHYFAVLILTGYISFCYKPKEIQINK